MKTITILITLICSISFAQINIETNFENSVYEVQEKGNKALFKRLSKGKIANIKIIHKGDFPEIINKEGIELQVSYSLILNNKKTVFTTDKLEKTLFPGDLFFPSNLFFPGDLFNELPKGNYKIIFNVKAINPEFNEMLRRRPSRIPLIFTIE